ncbi:MAG TPA: hypothetical protein ENF73_01690 [Proteobacteria bacterium]|nr:hypothetical protein [Pseudomonadota bacterium]
MRWTLATALLFALALMPCLASAQQPAANESGVGLNLSGYWRARWTNLFNPSWYFEIEDEDGEKELADSDWISYFDQRMLLDTKLTVNDRIDLNLQLDILKNVLWGNNLVVKEPAVYKERDPDEEDILKDAEFGHYEIEKGNVLSQSTSYTTADGEEIPSIQVRRLFADILTPAGRLRIGRMGSRFGMGIFSNDGDGIDSDFGDTYDQIMFLTKLGPVVPGLGYARVVEGDIWNGDRDVHQYTALALYLSELTKLGAVMIYRTQYCTNAHIFIYDLWAKQKVWKITIEGEAVILQGGATMIPTKTVQEIKDNLGESVIGEGGGKVEIDAYIAALRLTFDEDKWSAWLEGGFSSPSDPNPDREFDPEAAANVAEASEILDTDPDDPSHQIEFISALLNNQAAFGTKVYTFPFDSDYDVDLLLWEEVMENHVKNGIYAKLGAKFAVTDWFVPEVWLLKSWINESGKTIEGKNASHDLGWELDLFLPITIADRFTLHIDYGYLMTGQYFDDMYDGVKDLHLLRTRFVVDF